MVRASTARNRAIARLTTRLLAITVSIVPLAAQQPGDWRPRREIAERFATPMVWDAARERLVMFGGMPIEVAAETWESTDQTWTKRTPTVSPPIRRYHTMVFDSVRRRVLLFGGYVGIVGPAPQGDTWEWDGVAWQQRFPTTSPVGRWVAMMAFDAARGRAVLFGGKDAAYSDLGDTWEWDGANWAQSAPAATPSPRSQAMMTFDAARQRTLLFGGVQGTTTLGDTWEWNGTNWNLRIPTLSPSARGAASIAYDEARQRTVLVGGWDGSPQRLGDVWEWDGNTWNQPTMTLLEGRVFSPAAYHPGKQRTVLLGGTGNTNFRESQEWDGNTWHVTPPVVEPPERTQAAMTDGEGSPVLLFGGQPAGTGPLLADTWEWQSARWQQRFPAMSPPARRLAGMARDPLRQRVVLFGGSGLGIGQRNDTWEWNGITWSTSTPPVSPPARAAHALAFDPVQGRVLLYGGTSWVPFSLVIYYADTWEWDGTTWTQLSPANSPPARASHAMATDFQRQRVVLYGGASSSQFGDTWEWDGANWNQRIPATSPGTRFVHAMAYDRWRGRTVLFAGSGPQGLTGDTWEWDGTTWTQITPTSPPPPRREHSMAWDGEGQRLVLTGGPVARSTWLYGRIDDASTQRLGIGCTGSAGVPQLAANDPFVGNGACAIDLLHARAAAPALIALAATSVTVSLGSGCNLYVHDAVPLFVLTNGDGFASIRVPLPADPSLRGAVFYAQGAVLDPQGIFAGVALTAGLALRLAD